MSDVSRRDFVKLAGIAAAGSILANLGSSGKIEARSSHSSGKLITHTKNGILTEQVYNPYLPLNVYIPDGEPHLFSDRVYIYGSHDAMNAPVYCPGHYEVWSAPANNLHDWKCEGTSYLRNQDPTNANDKMQLWAPDVTQGPDGKFYLYYCFNFYSEIGVAVSDTPAGPFKFYGHVKYPSNILGGKNLAEHFPFDPAVLTDDDGRVYLYYGFAPAAEKAMPEITYDMVKGFPPEDQERYMKLVWGKNGMVVELEQDMITMKYEPKIVLPGGDFTAGTGFEGHGYFEAPSIRKIRGKYYLLYSSHKSHELCYATSNYPDRDFKYGGTVISNGDIGLNGRSNPVYPLSNNHGGIVQIGQDFYIFYHKATDGSEYSRQGSAEKIEILADGSIPQVEITSCGLNGSPLDSSGSYPAAIACHLTDPTVINKIDYNDPIMKTQIRVTEQMNHKFITDIKDKSIVGYKYFNFTGADEIELEIRGNFSGSIRVSHDSEGRNVIGKDQINIDTDNWRFVDVSIKPLNGKQSLYFHFDGTGTLDFKRFAFHH
ncbi:MAG: family 43 glycosylhydrolase [Selenomonadaceae bacterium]|nr:family 43 glycosylhydrolase [Selenomonadaceae bacterium]